MNRILPYLQFDSNFEMVIYFLPILLVYLLWIAYAFKLTSSKKFLWIGGLSYLVNNILMYVLLALATLLNVKSIASLNLLVAAINLLSLINLSYLLIEYVEEYKSKKADPDHVTRKHFSVSLHWSILLMSLALAILPFGTYLLRYSSIYIALMFILTASVNHLIARIVLRDERNKATNASK
ncbi:MAG: hypothetical protein Fur003_5600 [Candidatus Dojkabacteria bacterium]